MYNVVIRNNTTSETVVAKLDDIDWNENSLFWWTEGNFACDCNRWLVFEQGKGNDPDVDDAECGSSGFSVLEARLPTGEVIKIEE